MRYKNLRKRPPLALKMPLALVINAQKEVLKTCISLKKNVYNDMKYVKTLTYGYNNSRNYIPLYLKAGGCSRFESAFIDQEILLKSFAQKNNRWNMENMSI